MPDQNPPANAQYHLQSVRDAARQLDIGVLLFVASVNAGDFGPVRILRLGRRQFIVARTLLDFLQPRVTSPCAQTVATGAPAEVDLFAPVPVLAHASNR